MACFVVPAAEAVITAFAAKAAKEKSSESEARIPFARKLKWLRNLLLGGAILLGFEHIWHGEIVAYFPFLSAAANSADAQMMLHEMATTGVTMAAVVTLAWVGMLVVSGVMEKKALKETKKAAAE